MVIIERISLQGFRAYLKPQEILLSEGTGSRSVAIFAPNAKGKSSLVDAIEFYFSSEGTLSRLGRRRSGTQAGSEALISHRASSEGISPEVELHFRDGTEVFGSARAIRNPAAARTDDAERVSELIEIPPIVRGHDLNGFVIESAEDRYESVSNWFGLEQLLEIQRAYRDVRLSLEKELRDTTFDRGIGRELKTLTDDVVTVWSYEAIAEWLQTAVLSPLDSDLQVDSLAANADLIATLEDRKKEEESRLGITPLETLIASAERVLPSDGSRPLGSLPHIVDLSESFAIAKLVDEREQAHSKDAVFETIWSAAEELLQPRDPALEICPVCETPLQDTDHTDHAGLETHIKAQLNSIKSARAARKVLDSLSERSENARSALQDWGKQFMSMAEATGFQFESQELTELVESLDNWELGDPISNWESVAERLDDAVKALKAQKEAIAETQGTNTYTHALDIASKLVDVKKRVDQHQLYLNHLHRLQTSLSEVSDIADNAIRTHLQTIADSMAEDVNDVFGQIQEVHDSPVRIKFDLPPKTDTNQRRLVLTANVSHERPAAAPSGYLSDSEMHSLALALRLTALRRFNSGFKTVVLDDVVTSYDAEHRRAIASVLTNKFDDFQFLLVTHDERFFRFMKEMASSAKWIFKQIRYLDLSFGPVFERHSVSDEVIDQLLATGKSAATELRRTEEEWLYRMCQEFGVDIRIRGTADAYRYDRAELARALARFLKERSLVPPAMPGSANPFLASLQQGEVENFGSHFSDDPNEWGDIGDERHRWSEFKTFRDLFKCPACERTRFQRPSSVELPVCRREACQTPFSFSSPSDAAPD